MELGFVDGGDAGFAIGVVGGYGHLKAQHRAGLYAVVFEEHGEEGGGDLLAGGDEGVALSRVGVWRIFIAEGQEAVGIPCASGEDDHHFKALVQAFFDFFQHLLHASQVFDGGTPKFLHKNTHVDVLFYSFSSRLKKQLFL